MPKTLPKPAAVVFDLDGTLVDSLRDIAEALNHCLALLALPTHPVERYRYMVGEGVPTLCQRAVGDSHPHLVHRLAELVRPYYRTRAVCHTRPYAGVPELVAALQDRGCALGVLSNKPHELTKRVVQAFWPDGGFDFVRGYIEEQHRKPDPAYLLEMGRTLGVAPRDTWMVGDTPTDIETARRAGAVGIGVTWGFRTRDDLQAAGAVHIVDSPDELLPA